MELIDIIPEFNLYEEFWKIYTKSDAIPPQYISAESKIERSIISGGSEIYGDVFNSVIGSGVTVGKGTVVRDSIIMKNTRIGENCTVDKAIIAEEAEISDGRGPWRRRGHPEQGAAEDLFLWPGGRLARTPIYRLM